MKQAEEMFIFHLANQPWYRETKWAKSPNSPRNWVTGQEIQFFRPTVFFFFFNNWKLGLLLNEFKAALRIAEHSEILERPWCSLMNVLGFWEVMGKNKAGGILHGAGWASRRVQPSAVRGPVWLMMHCRTVQSLSIPDIQANQAK